MGIRATYKIAMAAGQDAGNRRMHADGRTEWNAADYAVACDVTAQLMKSSTGAEFVASRNKYRAAA